MVYNYLAIMQLDHLGNREQLEAAYARTRLRLERLTERGPLSYYHGELMQEAARAYGVLRWQLENSPGDGGQTGAGAQIQVGGRFRVGKWSGVSGGRCGSPSRPTGPAGHSLPSLLPGTAMSLRGRTVEAVRRGNGGHDRAMIGQEGVRDEKATARVEDEFCKQVIYRLEGDLLRFDSRRELLELAGRMQVGLYRANMLMAQIVEAVRQHKLYQTDAREPASGKGKHGIREQVAAGDERGVRRGGRRTAEGRTRDRAGRGRVRRVGWIVAAAVGVAAVMDVLLIRWLSR